MKIGQKVLIDELQGGLNMKKDGELFQKIATAFLVIEIHRWLKGPRVETGDGRTKKRTIKMFGDLAVPYMTTASFTRKLYNWKKTDVSRSDDLHLNDLFNMLKVTGTDLLRFVHNVMNRYDEIIAKRAQGLPDGEIFQSSEPEPPARPRPTLVRPDQDRETERSD